VNNNFDKATDRIVAAIENKMKFIIDKAVNIENINTQSIADIDDMEREIMKQIGQI
jgi:hypothetical protein